MYPAVLPPSWGLNCVRRLGRVVVVRNASAAASVRAGGYHPSIMPWRSISKSLAVPPVMRRGVWWLLGLSAFCGLAAVLWWVLRGPLGVPRGFAYRYGAVVLGLLPIMVLGPWWTRRTRHIRRALRESGGRLCTHCAYDVSTLAPSGTCPECGKPYDGEKDKPLWEAVVEMYGDKLAPSTAGRPSETPSVKPPR